MLPQLILRQGEGSQAKRISFIRKEEFASCRLPENWGAVCDSNGDGVRVKYPFKVRLFLAKFPKTFSVVMGNVQDQRMLIEKLSLDFSGQPFTLVP